MVVVTDGLRATDIVNKFPALIEPEFSLLCPQNHCTVAYCATGYRNPLHFFSSGYHHSMESVKLLLAY